MLECFFSQLKKRKLKQLKKKLRTNTKKNGKVRNVECGIHDIIKIMITLEKTKTCNLCLSLKFLALVSDDVEKLELQICTYM